MHLLFYSVMIGLLAVSFELASAIGYLTGLVLPEPIHRPAYFDCNGCRKIADLAEGDLPAGANYGWKLYDRDIGWDSYRNGKRRGPDQMKGHCASAFGDSFVHGDEVDDVDAWTYVLAERLGCEVENFGVGGYGLDQAYLKYLKYKPKGEIVIVGLTQETLRRNFAASWRFYASIQTAPKPFFHLHDGTLEFEQAPADLDRESIRKHHLHDRYAKPFVVQFPYSASLIRVLYYRGVRSAYASNRIEPYESAWQNPDAIELSLAILRKFSEAVSAAGHRMVVVMVPTADAVARDRRPYVEYIDKLKRMVPGFCIVDPMDALRAKFQAVGSLRAPEGHFNAAGNEAIASAVFAAIRGMPDSPADDLGNKPTQQRKSLQQDCSS
jgi:hypothetical protein